MCYTYHHIPPSPESVLLKPSFHSFLSFTFVAFQIHWPLSSAVIMSPDVHPVLFVLDLHMKYTVEVVPLYMYIAYGWLSCDSSPICKKCYCVFAHNYTLDDDSEHQMDYELSLLP